MVYDCTMYDDAPEPEDFDLADWPEALDAYRHAYDLARRIAERITVDTGMTVATRGEAARDLARLKSRLPLRGLDPPAEARLRAAIGWGEADGMAGVARRW
jgi:hypothetical protein